MKFSNYLLKLSGLTAIVLLLILAISTTSLSEYYLPIHPWIAGIFALITGLEHWYLMKSINNRPNRFSQVFMAVSALKLLAILAVTVVYLIIDRTNVIPFVIVLFIVYVIFTAFAVGALQKLVKGTR